MVFEDVSTAGQREFVTEFYRSPALAPRVHNPRRAPYLNRSTLSMLLRRD